MNVTFSLAAVQSPGEAGYTAPMKTKRFNEEMAIINGRGTWSADGSTLTLENGRVLTKDEQWSERDRLLSARLAKRKAKPTSVAVKRERARRMATGWY